ncbi:MAG: DUF411 domain-containing protein [Acidobacteria bacterium]|nr:DUF411 domain-containing protein [Acidobacteriota bacterium]
MRLRTILPVLIILLATMSVAARAADPEITVYKSKSCGCCSVWLDHLRTNGFQVTAHDVDDLDERKDKAKIPAELRSCHFGIVEVYAIEGHVPAADIHRLLKEKPKALGLAVPGMPMGSPGMDMGSKKDAFKVLLFTMDGKTSVWQAYDGN